MPGLRADIRMDEKSTDAEGLYQAWGRPDDLFGERYRKSATYKLAEDVTPRFDTSLTPDAEQHRHAHNAVHHQRQGELERKTQSGCLIKARF